METSDNQRFVVEAREHLAAMTAALIALERGDADPRARVEQLLRAAHSVKGGAGFTGRRNVERLAHALETAIENVREGRIAASAEAIDAMLAVLDRVGGMIDDLEHSDEVDISEPMTRLGPLIDAAAPPASGPGAIEARPSPRTTDATVDASMAQVSDFPLSERVRSGWSPGTSFLYGVKLDWFACEREFGIDPLEVARRLEDSGTLLDSRVDPAEGSLHQGPARPPLWCRAIIAATLPPEEFSRRLDIPCAAILCLQQVSGGAPSDAPRPAPRPRPPAAATSLRISVPLIDRMMELAGELALVRNQALRATDPTNASLRRLMRRLDSVTTDLQDAALRMRMQPVANLFDRFPRTVRDLARQVGKQIELQITGSEVELDKTVLEALADPLTHLIRNCCDHGIEPPEQRVRSGKPPTGLITLGARQDRGQIVIEVRDDGKGLDPEAIKRKAIESGIKGRGELDALNERQLFDLILLSGFSTAARVTDLSGRGVGMDVVKTNLEQIGGSVEIDSAIGRGTLFSLRLPLTLAIMPCQLVSCGERRYAIPQRDLEEIVLLEPDRGRARIECTQDEEVLRLRGALVPVVRLAEVLGSREPFTAETRARIIARHHPPKEPTARQYVAILRVGSHRFGLVVDNVLGSEDIVVKPLHPLLRQLGIFGAATILGDGAVALILIGEGIARHSGILHRPLVQELPGPPDSATGASRTLMLFRHGPSELLAMPLADVRRVVMIRRDRIERVGDRELVNVDGAAVGVFRLDQVLNLSACPDEGPLFLILPRNPRASVGLLASAIVDTPTLPFQLDDRAYKVDGVLGSSMIRGQIAIFIDVDRLVQMWLDSNGASRGSLPRAARRKVLVVEDTRFFQRLITSYLESGGFDVALAANGAEGLARLAEGPFDLIVSDIEMPVMDGLEFARRVRADARFAGIPMLALTTLSGPEHRARAAESGFDGYEVKLDRDILLAAVGALLGSDRTAIVHEASANE